MNCLKDLSNKDYIEWACQGLIQPYEESLIEKLREYESYGIPRSILLLSRPCCAGSCYPCAVLLSTGMPTFKIVYGDVNCFPKNNSFPNHSWVERNGFVYDPTDGFKWNKELYYMLFEPEIKKTLDQESAKNDSYYQAVITNTNKHISKKIQGLIVQYLELLEKNQPTVNQYVLLQEINSFKEKNNLPTYPNEVMAVHHQQMCKRDSSLKKIKIK